MAMEELRQYRRRIDAIDDSLVTLLAERFEIVRSVGRLKARHNIPVVQSARAEEVKDRVSAMAAEQNLDPAFVRHLYEIMIDHAHTLEDTISTKGSV